jgi:ABC-type transport system involved in cytochrome c biogenesis permease subunit
VQALALPHAMTIGGLIGGSLVASANFILYTWILPEVNNHLPQEQKITPFMLNFRFFELLRRHAELAPKSKLRATMYTLVGLGFFVIFIAVILSLPWSRNG